MLLENIQGIPDRLLHESNITEAPDLWQPLLDKPLRSRALEAAFFVAERMRTPDFVHETAERVRQQATYPTRWSVQSLAGDCGVALMYGYFDRCFPGKGWDGLAQRYLNVAATATQQVEVQQPGMFTGISGIALAVATASRGGQRYQKTLARLHQGISEQVLARSWRRPVSVGGVASSDYDVISGASGVLAYLVSIKQPDALVQEAIAHLLEYLIWLAEPDQAPGQERWYIPPALLAAEHQRRRHTQGHFNCGLAHGIPGPLAALAITWLAGYRYPDLRESIAYVSEWVVQHQVSVPWGKDWPDAVPFEVASSFERWKHLSSTLSAWCYGAPGVARSLWLAGQALEDRHLLQVAIEAVETSLCRSASMHYPPSPTLCHGTAGLLQICLRFAHENKSARVREHISILVQHMLDTFDPASALGFRDLDQAVPLDEPALLTGAPGAAIALLAASTSVVPSWDRALAIA